MLRASSTNLREQLGKGGQRYRSYIQIDALNRVYVRELYSQHFAAYNDKKNAVCCLIGGCLNEIVWTLLLCKMRMVCRTSNIEHQLIPSLLEKYIRGHTLQAWICCLFKRIFEQNAFKVFPSWSPVVPYSRDELCYHMRSIQKLALFCVRSDGDIVTPRRV